MKGMEFPLVTAVMLMTPVISENVAVLYIISHALSVAFLWK